MYEHCTHDLGPLTAPLALTADSTAGADTGPLGFLRHSSATLGLAVSRRFNQVDDSTVARFRYLTHDISRVTSFDNGIL